MNIKEHTIGTITAGLVAGVLINEPFKLEHIANENTGIGYVATLSMCILGAFLAWRLPDIDCKDSGYHLFVKWNAREKIEKKLGHRGIIHTPLCGIVFSLILFAFNLFVFTRNGSNPTTIEGYSGMKMASAISVGFFLSYLFHLGLDTFSTKGIMWFYPFTKKRIALGEVKDTKKVRKGLWIYSLLILASPGIGLVIVYFICEIFNIPLAFSL